MHTKSLLPPSTRIGVSIAYLFVVWQASVSGVKFAASAFAATHTVYLQHLCGSLLVICMQPTADAAASPACIPGYFLIRRGSLRSCGTLCIVTWPTFLLLFLLLPPAQAYDQAHAILDCICTSGIPLTADQLVHIDGLVALLEAPCFAFVRLALLGQPPGLPPDGGVDKCVGGVGHEAEAAVAAGTGASAGAGLRSAAATTGATSLAQPSERGCDVVGTSPSPYQAMAATYAAAVAGSAEVAAAAAAAGAGKGKSQAVHALTQQGGGDSPQVHGFSAGPCGTSVTGLLYEPPPRELVAAMQCLLVLLPQVRGWGLH